MASTTAAASAWFNKGEYDRAIPDFSEAIRINPKFAGYWGNRGGSLCGQEENMIAPSPTIDEAIRINPKMPDLCSTAAATSWKRQGRLCAAP